MNPIWTPGDPAPRFVARSTNNPNFYFDTAAGRYLVLSFFGSVGAEPIRKAIEHMTARRDLFDDVTASFFGVSIDPQDEAQSRVTQMVPGIRYFWDFDKQVSRLYRAFTEPDIATGGPAMFRPFTLVLDPMMRVIAFIPLADPDQHNLNFDLIMKSLPPMHAHAGVPMHAPVLILPRLFEPAFCSELIRLYGEHGGTESGFMREMDGKTVGAHDSSFKRRKDFSFDQQPEFEPLRAAIRTTIHRRLLPEIHKAFQFQATRIERYIVACYDAQSGGYFRPHRDNTTKGTAHRRFACTINLNAEEYEGGDLRFPEFGPQTYRAPSGGAVVFSCSVLHEATPVTRGIRYAFLPFLYDEAAVAIRKQNLEFLSKDIINTNAGDADAVT